MLKEPADPKMMDQELDICDVRRSSQLLQTAKCRWIDSEVLFV